MADPARRIARLSPEKRRLLEALRQERRGRPGPAAISRPQPRSRTAAPLSLGQERLWFLDQAAPGIAAYNVPKNVELRGALDAPALARSLAAVVRRHEILRTRYEDRAGGPVQVIEPYRRPPLPVVDLGGLAPGAGAQEADRVMAQESTRPFDLVRGPVLRAVLLRSAPGRHVLAAVVHHIAADGLSMAVLGRELAAGYAACVEGAAATAEPLPFQYADFARWQRERVAEGALDLQLRYWRDRLRDLEPVLDLSLDRPREVLRTGLGGREGIVLPAATAARLRELARAHRTTPFAAVLALVQVVLHRYSGRPDPVVGSPVAGRTLVELESLIGFFVNTLVFRADLGDDPPFDEALARVRDEVLAAQDHQEVPFERLVDELVSERSPDHSPLFQVMVAFQGRDAQARDLRLPGLRVRELPARAGAVKFDLTVALAEREDRFEGEIEYSLDLFDPTTVRRMARHLELLADRVLRESQRRLSGVDLLGPAERQQVAREWNDTRPPAASPATVVERVRGWVAAAPDAVAVTGRGGAWTYAELVRRARRLAAHLEARGAAPETVVAVCLDRSLEEVAALLGVLEAGAAYLPLDPAFPDERIAAILADSGARLVVAGDRLRGALPPGVERIDPSELPARRPERCAPSRRIEPRSLAYVVYTSGSTGAPKGVAVEHASLAGLVTWHERRFALGPGERSTRLAGPAFDASVWEIWSCLAAGAALAIPDDAVRAAPEELRDWLLLQRVTVCFLPTPMAEGVLGAAWRGRVPLRALLTGGDRLRLRPGDDLPFEVVNNYGPTECTVVATSGPVVPGGPEGRLPSVGRPIEGARGWVGGTGPAAAPAGVPGELQLGGAGVGRGYLGRPRLTAERFVPHGEPEGPGERLYRTGDRVRWLPDGRLDFLGRVDQQIKIRGFRIEPEEVRAGLLEHPAVRDAVVVARERGAERLLAAYVVWASAPVPDEVLRDHLDRKLPGYMVPGVFVPLDAVPLTHNGKVDRAALPEPAAARTALGASFAPPRTAAERTLAAVWSEVLGVAEVGIDDNFFSLGGDSILSLRARQAAAEAGVPFSVGQLFRHPTVRGLARAAGGEGGEPEAAERPAAEPFSLLSDADRATVPAGVEDAYPVTALQAGMLYHSVLEPRGARYHHVGAARVDMPLDVAAFRRAALGVMRRHAVLRTGFDTGSFSESVQLVYCHVEPWVEVLDLVSLPPAAQEAALRRELELDVARRFDPARPPLLRFRLARLSEGAFRLVWTEHHAILDGWSEATLLAELFGAYRRELGEEEAAVEPGGPAFRDYVALERQALASEEQREFWLGMAGGAPRGKLPRWPVLGDRRAEARSGGRLAETLDPELAAALGRTAAALGVPLKSVLLAAHVHVVAGLSGAPGAVTGLVVNGRPEIAGGDRLLGLFLNTVPFPSPAAAATWADLVLRCRETEERLWPYRRFPMAEVQRALGGGPLFETTFNFAHFHVLSGASRDGRLRGDHGFARTNFPLATTFWRDPAGGELRLVLSYDSEAVHPVLARATAGRYRRTLAAVAWAPHDRLGPWAGWSAAERHQLTVEWNDTAAVDGPASRLEEMVRRQAGRTPDAVAVSSGARNLSYRELVDRALRLAAEIRGAGARPEERVALVLERELEMVVALLGVLFAGCSYVPVDPGLPRVRRDDILTDAGGVSLAVAGEGLEGAVPAAVPVLTPAKGPSLRGSAPEVPASAGPPDPACAAYVLYTSGSSGRPKGVVVSHGAAVNHMRWMQAALPLGGGNRLLQRTPAGFDASVWEIFSPLIAGAHLVLAPTGADAEPEALGEVLARERITLLQMVPSLLRPLLGGPLPEGLALRRVYCGGEVLDRDLVSSVHRRLQGVELINLYGPTEATIQATAARVGPDGPAPSAPIGRPIANALAHVVGPAAAPVPIGAEGELLLGGEGLARGYLGRPALTAERFVPHAWPGRCGARAYRTGDLVRRLPGGELEFLGRADQQVKVRGVRVELGEIEAVLRLHPGVRDAAVVVEGAAPAAPVLAAFVVPAGNPGLPVAALRMHLAERLPRAFVPGFFTAVQELPRTASGKLDRRALPRAERRRGGPARAPRTDLEGRLVALWEEILGLSGLGVEDDFFALGGHSLAALRLTSLARVRLGRELSPGDLLRWPTVAELAAFLAAGRPAPEDGEPVPLVPDGTGPPAFWIHPVGGRVACYLPLARRLEPRHPAFGLEGPPEAAAASATVAELAERYLEQVRRLRPGGPWVFGGWSFGGWVAFEMACRAEARGEAVVALVLLDAAPPPSAEARMPRPLDRPAAVLQFARDLAGIAGVVLPSHALPSGAGEAGVAMDRLWREGRALGLLPAETTREELDRLFARFEANLRAARRYRPRGAFAGRALLVRAAGNPAWSAEGLDRWAGLCTGRLEVHDSPADHFSLLREPAVHDLARRVAAAIRPGGAARPAASGVPSEASSNPMQRRPV